MEYPDFVRFYPGELFETGYDAYIVFTAEPEKVELNARTIEGHLIEAGSVKELLFKLKRAKGVTGVMSNEIKVNKEAVMRKKVDILLDSPDRRLDYATIKLAAEKDVIIEVSLTKFINSGGVKRMRLFEETIQLLKIIDKFEAPFALTTAASSPFELRHRRQVEGFFSFLGADIKRARVHTWKLLRRLTDEKYIMDGVELEE